MNAFLLTANPDSWSEGSGDAHFLADQAERFEVADPLEESQWSTRRKTYARGDRVYLLLQGGGPRGIIASGQIVDPTVTIGPHWSGDGRTSPYVHVVWDAFVPVDEALDTETLERLAPKTGWQPMGSGTQVDDADQAAVAEAWRNHLRNLGLPDPSDPKQPSPGPDVTPAYRAALRKVRLHQRRFRRLLLQHGPRECAYCGLDVLQVLEAAHLIPDSHGGASSLDNGRLLCANHHRAFDAGLLTWDGERFRAAHGAQPVAPSPPES